MGLVYVAISCSLNGSANGYTPAVEGSGIRNSAGLWNDGLDDSTCKNNGAVYTFEILFYIRLTDSSS